MLPYRCQVTGITGNAAVALGTPGVWCEDNPSTCIVGAKQMLYWNQADGNNIEVSGTDLAGDPKSPAYNAKVGFANGAQTDIFEKAGTATQTSIAPGSTPTSKTSGSPRALGRDDWWFVILLAALHTMLFKGLVSVLL
ncbi:hypothetical protein H0H92_014745 [Tricholoma furcatifolium]|nr:hypothetical protein H0H92_014745 [Tricholoma furcatifolium]